MANRQYELNKELAQMLKGGVIMDVTTPEQAKIAEAAGACAVMALERIPADIRAAGGVSRMSDPKMIKGIQDAVSIPVMAKCRIGHFVEAQLLEAIEIDYIDESEVLSPADDVYHIDKTKFKVPFVCGAKDLGEALRRINEGASMIRTKGEPGTGDVVQAVRHMRMMNSEIARISSMREDELYDAAKVLQVPYDLVLYVHEHKRLPVVNFAAGGVATPADAALMMQLGAEGVFVGSGIFKSEVFHQPCFFLIPRILSPCKDQIADQLFIINSRSAIQHTDRRYTTLRNCCGTEVTCTAHHSGFFFYCHLFQYVFDLICHVSISCYLKLFLSENSSQILSNKFRFL